MEAQGSAVLAGLFDNYVEAQATAIAGIIPAPEVEHEDVAMPDITREEIRAQHEAIEARTDTKIVRMDGKLDLVLQSVQAGRDETRESRLAVISNQREGRRAIVANQWVVFASILAVIIVFVTAALVILDMGFKWRETISKEVNNRIPPLPPAPKK